MITKWVVTYCKEIAQKLLCLLNDRFIYLEPVTTSTNYIFRIVVLFYLRRTVFNLMHASPAVSHMIKQKLFTVYSTLLLATYENRYQGLGETMATLYDRLQVSKTQPRIDVLVAS